MPSPSLKKIRLATLLLPPVGLVLLWRDREVRIGRKLLGTLGVLLYSIVYAAIVVVILMTTAGMEVEWRGGFPPVLTFKKTKPDYEAVEAHRHRQTNQLVESVQTKVPGTSAYWT